MPALSHLKSVLVVEDDFMIGMDLIDTLKRLGCSEVEQVGYLSEALDKVRLQPPSLITMDIRLADAQCHPLVDIARELEAPFIYVTGCDRGECPDQTTPYVVKPVAEDALVSAILAVVPA